MKDQFTGKILADKYRIDSLISEGTLGNLYAGNHLSMDKPVAVKILAPALAADEVLVKRFADEARTISRISHPNILNVTDYGSDKNETFFIVFDEATGETLKNVIERNGKLPLERANDIVGQISSALAAAHANGIIHRNLTSDNILIKQTPRGSDEVKILNFGIAQSGGGSEFDELDATQKVEYLSPEQCAGGEVDERTDIYSLGVILYEMLTGEVPFTAEKPADILTKHAEQPPAPLSAFRNDLPGEVEQIVLTALAKNPDARYQNVNRFADELNQATISGKTIAGTVAPAALAAKEIPQNNIWKTAFIVLAGISILGALFIFMTTGKQTEPTTRLATDANGVPVQPVNPATGMTEQGLSNMSSFNPATFTNSNMSGGTTSPSAMPGGDGYDPWANGGRPPTGAPPTYVGPPGQQVYIPDAAGSGSIFMQDGNTYIMVPKNTNTASSSNTATRRNSNTNTNTATAPTNTSVKPLPNTAANTSATPQIKPTPAQNAKPTPTPAKPKSSPSPKKAATPAD